MIRLSKSHLARVADMLRLNPRRPHGGFFILNPGRKDELRIKNTLVGQGANLFLQSIFQGLAVLPANYYLGLTNVAYDYTATLVTMAAGEITTVATGYARQAIARSAGGWTVDSVNGIYRAHSATVNFTATANWPTSWLQMFLGDVAAGTAGNLFAVSGPAPTPRNVLTGAGPSVAYEFWLRG